MVYAGHRSAQKKSDLMPPPPPVAYRGYHTKIFWEKAWKEFLMRMDVMQAKEVSGREKPVWLRIGKAFEKEGRWRLKLDVLPLPNREVDSRLRLF